LRMDRGRRDGRSFSRFGFHAVAAGWRRDYRVPAIYVRLHLRSEGCRGHAREPAAEPRNDPPVLWRYPGLDLCQLDSALSRYGLYFEPTRGVLRGRLLRADGARRIRAAANGLAEGYPGVSRRDLLRAEFCVRFVCEPFQSRSRGRTRSLVVEGRRQCIRTGPCRHDRSVQPHVCAVWLRPACHESVLRYG